MILIMMVMNIMMIMIFINYKLKFFRKIDPEKTVYTICPLVLIKFFIMVASTRGGFAASGYLLSNYLTSND